MKSVANFCRKSLIDRKAENRKPWKPTSFVIAQESISSKERLVNAAEKKKMQESLYYG